MSTEENHFVAFAQTGTGFAVYGPAGAWKPGPATPPCNGTIAPFTALLPESDNSPHVPSDNRAIEQAQRSITDNLWRSFEAAVADFRRRPSLSRLRRVTNVGESVVDHAMRELREGRGS